MEKTNLEQRHRWCFMLRKILNIMRLTTLLFFLALFQVTATSLYSQTQRVNLDFKNKPLEEVFAVIEQNSNFSFFYKNELLKGAKLKTGHYENVMISEILDDVLKDENLTYTSKGKLIMIVPKDGASYEASFQQKSVSGKVTDSSGIPLPGVAVVVKGTTQGIITNADGNYTLLKVPGNATLVFSFVGMKTQEISVTGKTNINVTMQEETIGIDEVVAIGYGTVKKQDLTGAVASMKSDALTERSITSVGEAFAGQLTGVEAQQTSGKPGAELTIKIRGLSTINASNDPLYVIDGIPSGSSIKDLDPNDIASIEVLKDASSAAIYGARGACGVILITTKQGKKGKPTFNFSANYGLQKVDKILDMTDRDEYTAYYIWHANEAYLRAGGDMGDPMSSRGSSYQYPDSFENPETLPDVNWQKAIYRTAPMQTYHLSASGGGDIGSFLISGSYMNQDGIVEETGYQRMNLRINAILNVGNHLKVGMNLAPSFSKENNPDSEGKESALHHAIQMPPIVPLDSNTEEWGYTESASTWPNPLERLKEVYDETRTNKILSTVWGELTYKTLKFKSQYGYNFMEARNSYFRPSNINQGTASYGTFSANDKYDWTFQNTLTYSPEVSSLFNMDILLGQSIEGGKYYKSNGKATGYPNDLIYTLNVASTAATASTAEYKSALASFFGRATFNMKDKYLLTMNLRRDGSSNFGEDTKWGWFPSASIGWKIDREKFMQNTSDWLDLLKIRLSVGKTGNNSIGYYNSVSMLKVTNYNYNGSVVSGLSPSSVGNSELGWETKVSKNIGLDMGVLKGRIQANLDYYIDDTKDMLQEVPVSYMSGYSTILQNLGEVRNKGWEFEITSHNLNRSFKWTTSFNISKNTNEVKKLGNDNADILTSTWGYNAYIIKVGEAMSSFYMYKTDGVLSEDDFDADGNALVPVASGQEAGNVKIVDVTPDGKINSNDLTIVGNNLPDFTWGLTNQFRFKGFDLRILLQGSHGGKVFLLGRRHMDMGDAPDRANFSRWVHCWKPTRTESTLPENTNVDMSWDGKTPYPFGNNPRYNENWLYDASFVRIKNLTLGYSLSKRLCNKWHIGGARIYVMCDNLHTWNHYPGATPETNSYGSLYDSGETLRPGTDYATYPISRKYTLGINLTF